MTRRDFILGFMGAGMAGGAVARPVRSSIAADSSIKGAEGWVNPYVTDGLIGFWNGEWNVAGGVHGDSADTWVDLSGSGRDATLSGKYSWGENYWHVESVSGKGLATWPAQNLGNDQTIEFVIEPIATSGYGRVIAEAQAVASPIITSIESGIYVYGFGVDRGPSVQGYNNRERHLHQIVHASGGYILYYIDGSLKWSNERGAQNSTGTATGYFANRADYGRGIDADYFTMRRYNRVLTEEELAHNLFVDEGRFF